MRDNRNLHCNYCDGQGSIRNKPCPKCAGKGKHDFLLMLIEPANHLTSGALRNLSVFINDKKTTNEQCLAIEAMCKAHIANGAGHIAGFHADRFIAITKEVFG